MNTVAKKKAKARAQRPIYLIVRKVADVETGEVYGALVPANSIDRRLLRERKFTLNREIRAELKQSRNPAFHRLAHAVGNLLADNVEKFRHLSGHAALKAVQQEAGVCCEPLEIDLGPLGKVQARTARSIAFDEMDEAEFGEFFTGICDWIDQHYASVMTVDVRAEYLLMIEGNGNG